MRKPAQHCLCILQTGHCKSVEIRLFAFCPRNLLSSEQHRTFLLPAQRCTPNAPTKWSKHDHTCTQSCVLPCQSKWYRQLQKCGCRSVSRSFFLSSYQLRSPLICLFFRICLSICLSIYSCESMNLSLLSIGLCI